MKWVFIRRSTSKRLKAAKERRQMSKKQKVIIESNDSFEEVNGFVPVQYKILKLEASYILSCKKKEVPKEKVRLLFQSRVLDDSIPLGTINYLAYEKLKKFTKGAEAKK